MLPFLLLVSFLSISSITNAATPEDVDKLLVEIVDKFGEKMMEQVKSDLAAMDPDEAGALAPVLYGRLGAKLDIMLMAARQGAKEAAREKR